MTSGEEKRGAQLIFNVHQKHFRLCPMPIYTHTSSPRGLKAADVLTISIHTKSLHKKSHVKVAITSALWERFG